MRDLCAGLGAPLTDDPDVLAAWLHDMQRAALASSALDSFAEQVCSTLGARLLRLDEVGSGGRTGPAPVAMGDALVLLSAALDELALLRRLHATTQSR